MLAASEKRNKGESGSSGVVSTKLDEYGRVREGAGSELSSIPEKLWDTMPEYQKDGVRSVLEPRGLYQRRDTRNFVSEVFRLYREKGHCLESSRPRAFREGA